MVWCLDLGAWFLELGFGTTVFRGWLKRLLDFLYSTIYCIKFCRLLFERRVSFVAHALVFRKHQPGLVWIKTNNSVVRRTDHGLDFPSLLGCVRVTINDWLYFSVCFVLREGRGRARFDVWEREEVKEKYISS